MLKYAMLILWRKKDVVANFYAFCISDTGIDQQKLFFTQSIEIFTQFYAIAYGIPWYT